MYTGKEIPLFKVKFPNLIALILYKFIINSSPIIRKYYQCKILLELLLISYSNRMISYSNRMIFLIQFLTQEKTFNKNLPDAEDKLTVI